MIICRSFITSDIHLLSTTIIVIVTIFLHFPSIVVCSHLFIFFLRLFVIAGIMRTSQPSATHTRSSEMNCTTIDTPASTVTVAHA